MRRQGGLHPGAGKMAWGWAAPVLFAAVLCLGVLGPVPAEGRAAAAAQAREPSAPPASRGLSAAETPPSPRRVPSAADTGDGFDGEQWRAAGPAGIAAPLALAVDPEREDRVYLATADGLYASPDGGRGWSVTALPGVAALALSPSDPRHLVVVADGGEGRLRLWRSADRGASWRPGGEIVGAAAGTPSRAATRDAAATPRVVHATFHPDRADLLYLAGSVGPSGPRASAHTDSRATAPGTDTPSSPPPPAGRLWASRDGGETLTGHDLPPGLVPLHLLVRRDGTLLAATAAGVWRSGDQGRSWQPSRLGLEGRSAGSFRSVLRLAASADAPEVIYAGTASGPGARGTGATAVLFRSADGGASWAPVAAELPPGDVADLVVDPRDPRSLWLAAAGAGVHSTRGGGWQALGPPLPDDADPSLLALGPDHPRTLWAATPGGDLYRRSPPSPECVDDVTTLCLAGRFRVDLTGWGEGAYGDRSGHAVPLTAGSGWFWLDRPEHPAVAVEAVPVVPATTGVATTAGAATTGGAAAAGEAPAPSAWRVRATVLTAAGVDVRVFDVESGRFESFRQAEGGRDGATHTATFPARRSADGSGDVWFASLPEGGCGGDSIDLCLHDGRFEVRVDWYDGEGAEGAAVADRLSDAAGWFRFRRPDEPELFVEVVDARRGSGHWSVVFGALTDFGFELTVTDRESGETVAYGVEPGDGGSHRDRHAFAEPPPG